MTSSIATNYKSVLCDIFDSEELKIESEYSRSIKKTIQEICEERNDKFEECFLKIKEDVVKAKDSNKEEHCYGKMYLHLAEELSKAIGKLSGIRYCGRYTWPSAALSSTSEPLTQKRIKRLLDSIVLL